MTRRADVVAIGVAVAVAAALVVGVVATNTDEVRGGLAVGPGQTIRLRPGQIITRLTFPDDASVVALVTTPGASGVWAVTRTDSSGDIDLDAWHVDPNGAATRWWDLGSTTQVPDAVAVCGDRVWVASGGEYGGRPVLSGLDTGDGTVLTRHVPDPQRPNRTGATGIEGPGRVVGLTCHGADGSVRFARAYWTSLFTFDVSTGAFSEEAMTWDRFPVQRVADETGDVAVAWSPVPPSDTAEVTFSDRSGGARAPELPIRVSSSARLVARRDGFLVIDTRQVRLIGGAGRVVGGRPLAVPGQTQVDTDAGGGVLGDGRIVVRAGSRVVFLDPAAPALADGIVAGRAGCLPRPAGVDHATCLRVDPLVAVDDHDHVFVTDPATHSLVQVGVPTRG